MKEINDLILPDDLLYTKDHEWAKKDGETIKIGITDYAQDQLGDIVFVEFPEVGDSFEEGEEIGTLESVKAVSEMYMPISGEIVAINNELEDTPELLNKEVYNAWIVEIKPSDASSYNSLLKKDAYLNLLKG